eukprot:274073_1
MRTTELISLLIFIFTSITTSNPHHPRHLNLSDYTFYYHTHDYPFPIKPSDDILIQLPNTKRTLNFSNDADFDEIYLTPATTTPHQIQHTHSRQLLWNKWDHTTSKHVKGSGRFVGDPSRLRTFDDARALCREYYGDITSIQSPTENKEVQALCKQMKADACWIGLTANFYEWENGQYVSWSNWAADKPEHSINEKCIKIQSSDGKWDDSPCNKELYTICEKPVAKYHGNYVVVSRQTTKEKASKYCKDEFGSTLASIITKTDALQAHAACKMIAKAPHGCWMGLTAPFETFDNGLSVETIKGLMWRNDRKPSAKRTKCAEVGKDGLWRGVPCDYERHILCNVHGVDTQQSQQDTEFLKAKEEEKNKEKAKEIEQRKEQEEKQREEDKKEMEQATKIAEGETKKVIKKVNPESPIEKQIDELKQILKKQQDRLSKEKLRFEGGEQAERVLGVEKGNDVHVMTEKQGKIEERKRRKSTNKERKKKQRTSTKGIRDEIKRLEKLDFEEQGKGTGELEETKEAEEEGKPIERHEDKKAEKTAMKAWKPQIHKRDDHTGDRMGDMRRKERMVKRMKEAANGKTQDIFGTHPMRPKKRMPKRNGKTQDIFGTHPMRPVQPMHGEPMKEAENGKTHDISGTHPMRQVQPMYPIHGRPMRVQGGYNPFGGAFGGPLRGTVGNPYNYGHVPYGHGLQIANQGNAMSPQQPGAMPPGMNGAAPPPPPPMSPQQYNMMMQNMQRMQMMYGMNGMNQGNYMNPMRLPRIPGMQGKYADRRRLMEDREYKAVMKCMFDIDYRVCVEYDFESASVAVDVMNCDTKKRKKKTKRRNKNMEYNVNKYVKMNWWSSFEDEDHSMRHAVVDYGVMDADYIQYFIVFEFEFVFDGDEDYFECRSYSEEDDNRVCISKSKGEIGVHLNENIFDYAKDGEWTDIYIEEKRKCVFVRDVDMLCAIQEDVDHYRIEMNVATYKLPKQP